MSQMGCHNEKTRDLAPFGHREPSLAKIWPQNFRNLPFLGKRPHFQSLITRLLLGRQSPTSARICIFDIFFWKKSTDSNIISQKKFLNKIRLLYPSKPISTHLGHQIFWIFLWFLKPISDVYMGPWNFFCVFGFFLVKKINEKWCFLGEKCLFLTPAKFSCVIPISTVVLRPWITSLFSDSGCLLFQGMILTRWEQQITNEPKKR